jgi:nucleoside phosphorylase
MQQDQSATAWFPSRISRLFLHFFDIHFLAAKGKAVESSPFQLEMRLATRLAVASAQKVYIPAASFFESAYCRQALEPFGELIQSGVIVLCGSSSNMDEFIRERQDAAFYREGSVQFSSYRADIADLQMPAYVRRERSSTRDVVSHWKSEVDSDRLSQLLRDATGHPIAALERRIEIVPSELGALAFIPEHVYEILDLSDSAALPRSRVRAVINEGYFNSFLSDLQAGYVTDLSYLASDFALDSHSKNLSYSQMVRYLHSSGMMARFMKCEQNELIRIGSTHDWQRALEASQTYAHIARPRTKPSARTSMESSSDRTHPAKGAPVKLVLCITAAPSEFIAVVSKLASTFLKEAEHVYLDSAKSEFGMKLMDPKSGVEWVVLQLNFQGESEAASRVERWHYKLRPDAILMIGMCMGMPKKRLAVGTVVIPNEVTSFDHQRLKNEATQYRPHGARVSNGLYMLGRNLAPSVETYKVIPDKGLASASIKVEDVDSNLVGLIENAFPDVVAFDMEGAGFYKAGDDKNCLWIKAIADTGESQATSSEGQDAKKAIQASVTENAAEFAVLVVRAFFAATAART